MWSSLYVISASTEKLLFYADNLAILELVTKVHFLRLEQYQIKSVNSDDVTKTAMLLGNVIKNQGAMQGWHLDVEDNESTIPESWSNSCQTMLIGNFFNGGPLNEWLATSFGIDLLCAVSRGGVKPPCHHLLLYIVKSLIGNTELVHTPNRLGDSVLPLDSAE